ncbi:MAG: hypothetical protein AB7K37_04955 [Cyclobacteriaceae bacterium]
MIGFKWFFRFFSPSTKVDYLKDQGILLGSRIRQGRKIYLYMIKDIFVEVIFKNDSIDQEPERLETFNSLKKLNMYLEREILQVA